MNLLSNQLWMAQRGARLEKEAQKYWAPKRKYTNSQAHIDATGENQKKAVEARQRVIEERNQEYMDLLKTGCYSLDDIAAHFEVSPLGAKSRIHRLLVDGRVYRVSRGVYSA